MSLRGCESDDFDERLYTSAQQMSVLVLPESRGIGNWTHHDSIVRQVKSTKPTH